MVPFVPIEGVTMDDCVALAKDVAGVKPQLAEQKYPATYREVAEMGKEYLDRKTFEELVRWVDSLDKF